MTRINLLPWRSEQRKTLTQQFLCFTITAVLLTSIVMMIIHNVLGNKIDHRKKQNTYLKAEVKQQTLTLSRINTIQTLQKKRMEDVRLFDEFGRVVPHGIILTLIKREENKITLHGKEESNTELSQFIRQIEKSKLFSQAELQEIKTNTFILQTKHERSQL